MKKVDKKYNNEFEDISLPGSENLNAIRSSNYYGLNSNDTNISAKLIVGIGFKL